jgi:hypothetical protein
MMLMPIDDEGLGILRTVLLVFRCCGGRCRKKHLLAGEEDVRSLERYRIAAAARTVLSISLTTLSVLSTLDSFHPSSSSFILSSYILILFDSLGW